jgi:tRNA pseudouridine13 synthase
MYLSKTEGIKGEIKKYAEDFIVEEITKTGKVIEINKKYTAEELGFTNAENNEKKFVIFIMQKKNWNTIQALKAIAKTFRKGIASVGFAGTKDRTSISTQLCSIYGISNEDIDKLKNIKIKDIQINAVWRDDKKIELGNLLGNRFSININYYLDRYKKEDIKEKIEKTRNELNGIFPNYFGEQRFGVRKNNVEIGINLLKGDFEKAVMLFLTDNRNENNVEAIEARKRLSNEGDFKNALNYFPKYLKYERLILEHLSKISNDYETALRKLPRSLLLMFTHSVSAYIFNYELDYRIKNNIIDVDSSDLVCPVDNYLFPDITKIEAYKNYKNKKEKFFIVGNIVGYNTLPNEIEKNIIDKLGLKIEDFKVRYMRELENKGSHRVLFTPFKDFVYSVEENKIKTTFSLPSGSYATVLIDEFMKNNKDNKIDDNFY